MQISNAEATQLRESIDKLLHYLLAFVTETTTVRATLENEAIYDATFTPARVIAISPTLYTRVDGCHGAGNCCRVPFDLVYTAHDRRRVLRYDHMVAEQGFGKESAQHFRDRREQLLDALVPVVITFTQGERTWKSELWVQRNVEEYELSGTNSCRYLRIGDDRYFCGVHPFKPLHCWMPHMTIRSSALDAGRRVSIGRMQYGRNHRFGCPVIFTETAQGEDAGIFDEPTEVRPTYFERQYHDDLSKLDWLSKSAQSLEFHPDENKALSITQLVRGAATKVAQRLRLEKIGPVDIWREGA